MLEYFGLIMLTIWMCLFSAIGKHDLFPSLEKSIVIHLIMIIIISIKKHFAPTMRASLATTMTINPRLRQNALPLQRREGRARAKMQLTALQA